MKFNRLFLYFCFTLIAIGTFLVGYKVNMVGANTYPYNGVISADSLVVHVTPDTSSSSAVTELVYGSRVKVIGSSGNFFQIEYDGGKTGYVSRGWVVDVDSNTTKSNVAGIETYEEYCTALKNKGFVDSYCPYLYYLHAKHPTWVFTADKPGVSLETASAGEVGHIVLQTNNPNYWAGTPIEGNYYPINASTIASMMDPRNSLFENTIFQFANLEKNTEDYNDAALLAATNSGYLSNFVSYYVQAGKNVGVNPLHMLTRGVQEGMNNSSYGSVSGHSIQVTPQGYSLKGYYNFFNVGAWETTGYSAVSRGLAHAAGFLADSSCISYTEDGNGNKTHYYDEAKCGQLSDMRPWNTPEKAILGGSSFLAKQYVKSGQNTLFFQKYNIASYRQAAMYTHQYMTNSYAPISEGRMLFNAYNKGSLLDRTFEFIIPVYENMGEVYQPVNKDGDARLADIKINGELITGFDSDVVEYSNIKVITDKDSIDVTASTLKTTSSLSGTGNYKFENDVVTVEINTKAEDGAMLKYVVTVTRVLPENKVTVEDIVSKLAVKINGDVMYGISPGTNVSTIISSVTSNKGTAKLYTAGWGEKNSGTLGTGDKLVIYGTTDQKTYNIAVKGDLSGDGLSKINDLILIQSHILGTRVLSGPHLFAGDISGDGAVKINDLILVQSHILGKGNL